MNITKIGIAGTGAIGRAVCRALQDGIKGFELTAVSDLNPAVGIDAPCVGFPELAERCGLIIECLPPAAVPALAREALSRGKDIILISSCAWLMYPEIRKAHELSTGRIIVPSGALAGLDGVRALKNLGIKRAGIASTKPPMGFSGAPYVDEMGIDLSAIMEKTRLFSGNALEAAAGFPANVNVAATLSLAGIGAGRTEVEIWADPAARGNSHEIRVEGQYSTITARVENTPDPANPKSSMLAAQSIVAVLKGMTAPLAVL